MNKQELIEHFEEMEYVSISQMGKKSFIDMIEQLDEPQPLKLKDVIARIKSFDSGTRKVWLDGILNELGSDYGTLKYKAGYEQGKLEGGMIPFDTSMADKPTILKFIADWIKYCKNTGVTLVRALMVEEIDLYNYANQKDSEKLKAFLRVEENQDLFARAWLDGYTVEEEKRYLVKMKGMQKDCVALKKNKDDGYWYLSDTYPYSSTVNFHTRKELEQAGFEWVFDCPGIEIEEVEG